MERRTYGFETTISRDADKGVFSVNNAALHMATLRVKPRLLTKRMLKVRF
jgi:hypothetical protein